MKFEYSSALLLALQRTSRRARLVGRQAITTEDLLAGLLAESEGLASQVLLRAGLELQALPALLGLASDEILADEEPLAFSGEVRSALRQAQKLAALYSEEGSITSDQALLCLLQNSPEWKLAFETHGLQFNLLQGQIIKEAEPIYFNEPLFSTEPTQSIDLARILDACANRAREALRILEDYARFVLNDALLSGLAKQMRHELAGALSIIPPDLLIEARETLHDVGTTISTADEWERPGLQAVVQANAKRLQEALRSLEEFGKVVGPDLGKILESLRYQSYTLERALVLGGPARDRLQDARLYLLVTESLCRASLVGTVKEAILGGVQVVQLREKNRDDRSVLSQARELRKMTRDHGVIFIINDRPDIAVLAEADGVHLGQDDLPIRDVRRLLGPGMLIGISTHDPDQLHRAVLEGASYVGIGPTFPSQTKEFKAFAGLEFIRTASEFTSLPTFALGGVTCENLPHAMTAGAQRIAVSQALCAAADPRKEARKLRELLDAQKKL